ncbi:hypothetical protein QVA66_07655 [Staphylococcus chromogenes]|nr:hypothetical protein [Staphylococcus chromogenes]
MHAPIQLAANHVANPSNLMEKVLAYQPLQALTGLYGKIAVGGHLAVSELGLEFAPHVVNLSSQYLRIPREQIATMEKRQRLAARLLVVTTVDGQEFEFVTWQRDTAIDALKLA